RGLFISDCCKKRFIVLKNLTKRIIITKTRYERRVCRNSGKCPAVLPVVGREIGKIQAGSNDHCNEKYDDGNYGVSHFRKSIVSMEIKFKSYRISFSFYLLLFTQNVKNYKSCKHREKNCFAIFASCFCDL